MRTMKIGLLGAAMALVMLSAAATPQANADPGTSASPTWAEAPDVVALEPAPVIVTQIALFDVYDDIKLNGLTAAAFDQFKAGVQRQRRQEPAALTAAPSATMGSNGEKKLCFFSPFSFLYKGLVCWEQLLLLT